MEQTTVQNWNLESLYAGGSESTELKNLIAELKALLAVLSENLAAFNEGNGAPDQKGILEFINHFQYIWSGWEELDDFVYCLYAQNTEDNEAFVLMDESDVIKAELNSLQLDFDRILAAFPEEDWAEFIRMEEVQPYAFYLEERRRAVQDRLPVEMERLIQVLSVNGINGWEQHHEQALAHLKIPLELGGEMKEVSIGQALNEAMYAKVQHDRKRIADAITALCTTHAPEFASMFNRIAGFRLDVYAQRGWTNMLKEAVEQNRIKEESIRAMLASIDGNKPLYQAYVRRKIELEKLEQIGWYDLESPFFNSKEKISYTVAKDIIITQFHGFSEKLGRFAEQAFEDGWIETENRPDKAGGGFCASMPLRKESRIFMTFRENYQDVVTLAHELGHAYHNHILHDEPALAQQKGTCVAESASTFLENLVLDAAIERTSDINEKLALLEVKIRDGLKYIVSVPNMFRFEQAFYGRRMDGSLTVDDINELITEVETDFYGEMVEELATHKWMYISHFYSADKPFYNIPYTLGYLFSNGIYNLSKAADGDFQEQYDELLRNSGRMTVEELAKNYLGADLTEKEFWNAAQQSLKDAIKEYLELTEAVVAEAD